MIIFKNRCYNGGPRHKFKAIYTEKKNRDLAEIGGSASFIRSIVYYLEYVKTQCEWCGKIKDSK
jgi:hypothetical protein